MVAVQIDAIHSFPSNIEMMKLNILPFSGSFANAAGPPYDTSWSMHGMEWNAEE
jgi:hypothetical protein